MPCNYKKTKTRKKFKMTKATARKIVKNPKTPPQLKKYYRKKFKIK